MLPVWSIIVDQMKQSLLTKVLLYLIVQYADICNGVQTLCSVKMCEVIERYGKSATENCSDRNRLYLRRRLSRWNSVASAR